MQSLNLMLPKEERKAMLLRLYNDDSPLIDHNKERNMKPNGAKLEDVAKEPTEETKPDIGSADDTAVDAEAEADGAPTEEAMPTKNGTGDAGMENAE